MAEANGYDSRCPNCECPYTFKNAQAVGTNNWRRFCSPGCERGETAFWPLRKRRAWPHPAGMQEGGK